MHCWIESLTKRRPKKGTLDDYTESMEIIPGKFSVQKENKEGK